MLSAVVLSGEGPGSADGSSAPEVPMRCAKPNMERGFPSRTANEKPMPGAKHPQ